MPSRKPAQWDREVDVVVLGTGGAALVAAIAARNHGAEVLILEKTAQIGGTTAFSGGIPWIAMNRYMAVRQRHGSMGSARPRLH